MRGELKSNWNNFEKFYDLLEVPLQLPSILNLTEEGQNPPP
eukprot:CAMPEP_0114597238 /NCGR_PEP_ID=MMETSP0125-20121206/19474_1 /TAXON_ID=485358 ORGANISM="Aristerostoma sp., Strain ATCC 50986" /NCGR_SAMPLE_ID=MMETSP0125 /ASSEMBLY_ACC=CAM_ASM_000245 /LENGTH=40 /DNA_ID= /DNA_START= /DNA_END= /DNA_ORIENTATION=